MIEKDGISQANLKMWDVKDMLKLRNQTSLRDKAKNIKMAYLK